MKTSQNIYTNGKWQSEWSSSEAQLVLVFGSREHIANPDVSSEMHSAFPDAQFIGCTTSGEIQGSELYDDSLCLTAVTLESSQIQTTHVSVDSYSNLSAAVEELTQKIDHRGLKYILALSDGQKVNGTEFISELQDRLPEGVCITGGLAGDGTRFNETVVWHNENVKSGNIVLCGFYGENIAIGHGSVGGWDPFGPERVVTKSKSNVLYSLDDKPALELYKTYLGEHANDLPSSALLFPLLVKSKNGNEPLIRTILNIDESDNSMIFAGDIPEGATAQLMSANFDRLIDGAESAAENSLSLSKDHASGGLALLVSCVGRRLVLNQRVEEELEVVTDVLGDQWTCTGFYSYGEISPLINNGACALHNQTMTITTLYERDA